jgi:hypothetical protein
VNDAKEMLKLATRGGFSPVVGSGLLLDDEASSTNIFGAIKMAAARLSAGDVFLLTFSGHGLQQDGDDELDRMDEAWVLFDRIVIDDHISAALHEFETGVRVVVVADTCHAGGDIDELVFKKLENVRRRFRVIPRDVMASTIATHPDFVAPGAAAGAANKAPKASILLIAACAENELAQDSDPNGVFTAVLVNTATESPTLGYEPLIGAIKQVTRPFGQNPELHPFGPGAGTFLTEPVFTVPK